jgi:hypothetical protein
MSGELRFHAISAENLMTISFSGLPKIGMDGEPWGAGNVRQLTFLTDGG